MLVLVAGERVADNVAEAGSSEQASASAGTGSSSAAAAATGDLAVAPLAGEFHVSSIVLLQPMSGLM